MAYSFFSIPPEVRIIIYEVLFMSPLEANIVTPDPERTRKANGLEDRALHLTESLSLLCTCQQIHEEASTVLYGRNVFTFDDRPHGMKIYTIPGFHRSVRWCDFTMMYSFLSLTGSRNRRKIKHLRLSFSGLYFILYPDEAQAMGLIKSTRSLCSAANFLGDALDLLSQHHELATVEILMENESKPPEIKGSIIFMVMFWGNRKLIERLCALKGISHLQFPTAENQRVLLEQGKFDNVDERRVLEKAYPRFLRLKATMEAADPEERSRSEDKWDEPTKYGFDSNPTNQISGEVEQWEPED